jgi:TMEM175 potassium channel family protein
VSKSRVEAFSGGIVATAITLLVLTVAQPSTYRKLGHQLRDRWPSLAAYVVSFIVIGIMWFNHRSVFSYFDRIDRPVVYLNQLLLLTVVFVPYVTSVLRRASSARRCDAAMGSASRPWSTPQRWP